MATFRIVRIVVTEAYIEAEDKAAAWDYLAENEDEVLFEVIDEFDEVREYDA